MLASPLNSTGLNGLTECKMLARILRGPTNTVTAERERRFPLHLLHSSSSLLLLSQMPPNATLGKSRIINLSGFPALPEIFWKSFCTEGGRRKDCLHLAASSLYFRNRINYPLTWEAAGGCPALCSRWPEQLRPAPGGPQLPAPRWP